MLGDEEILDNKKHQWDVIEIQIRVVKRDLRDVVSAFARNMHLSGESCVHYCLVLKC